MLRVHQHTAIINLTDKFVNSLKLSKKYIGIHKSANIFSIIISIHFNLTDAEIRLRNVANYF